MEGCITHKHGVDCHAKGPLREVVRPGHVHPSKGHVSKLYSFFALLVVYYAQIWVVLQEAIKAMKASTVGVPFGCARLFIVVLVASSTGAGRPQSHPLLKRATTGYIWFEQHSAPCCVIVPEKGSKASLLIRIWDDLIIVVLLIEAFWAPLVFAFPPFYNFYYRAFSRLQDVLLSADIAANFFVAVPKDIDGGSRNLWEKRSSRIAKRY
eukprot:1043545-Amphidinium_carterae.4